MEFTYNNSFQVSIQTASYVTLHRRKCRLPLHWEEIDESKVVRLKMIQEIKEEVQIIRDKLSITQSRHQSYVDNHKRGLSFDEGNLAFLKVSAMRGVKQFGKKGKLSLRYVGPLHIL